MNGSGMKFKVGDRIVVTTNKWSGKCKGMRGVITEKFTSCPTGWYVTTNNAVYIFLESEMEIEINRTWSELTDIEKGALLLAHQRGEVIEFYNCVNEWVVVESPSWLDHFIYRVKLKTKVVLYGSVEPNGYSFFGQKFRPQEDTYKITFDIIDEIPDCNSIKLEKLCGREGE